MIAQRDQPIEQPIRKPHETLKIYSAEEFLAWEIGSETRHEYIDGEIIPMTGGMPNHNRILRNLCTAMTLGVRGQAYDVFVADQRLWIPEKRIYAYPDLMIVQGNLELQAGRKDTITNPLLILEVLSKSTQDYDKSDKFSAYQTIPSFEEYLLVDQYSQHIEQYVRVNSEKWELQAYDETDPVVRLATISLEIKLTEIYEKVEFE